MVTQSAKDAAFGAKLFYNGIMFSVVAMCIFYDCDLQKAILSFNIPYVVSFFGLFYLSHYLFRTCAANPGMVEPNVSTRELSAIKIDGQEGTENLLQCNLASGPLSGDLESGLDSSLEPEEETVKSRSSNASKNKDNGNSKQRYCDKCEVYQPYRSKHCKQCERCVLKFDHHCFWIGGCVGELNHRKFWLFLFFQTILELWAYLIADSGQDAGYLKGLEIMKSGKKGVTSAYTTSEYGAFTVAVGATLVAFLFTGILLGFHTFLVVTNQSTWEFSKKDKLSYLKEYPRSFYPFSEGIIGNIKAIFFHGNVAREWELPPIPSGRRRKQGFNWCENEYYSCC